MSTVSSATKSKKALSLSEKYLMSYLAPIILSFGVLNYLYSSALVNVDILQNGSGQNIFLTINSLGTRNNIALAPGIVTSNEGIGIYQVIGIGLLAAMVLSNFFFRVIWLERIIVVGYVVLIILSVINTLILTSVTLHAPSTMDIKVSITYYNMLIPFFYFMFAAFSLQRMGQLKKEQTAQG